MAFDLPEGTIAHPVNKRRKSKILVSVWDFGAVFPQSEREHYVCNHHPAKMRPCLARAILQLFGESPVLDPMAGIGTTLVEAMLLGMDAVGVEYEKRFVDQASRNITHVANLFCDRNLGKAVCIKGDARDLSCLNTQRVNTVIFSPPYFNAVDSVSPGSQDPEGGHLERQHRLAKEGKSGYGDKDNIGHVERYGSIVFSPPYANTVRKTIPIQCREVSEEWKRKASRSMRMACEQGYSDDEGNIGNIPIFGSIVFSPPYYGVMDAKRHVGGISARDFSLAKTGSYSKDQENIGNTRNERTYLREMFKIYMECHRVLRPGKFMVVVVKDIRRKNLTIPLGADTIKLCQLAGFELFDIIVNKMYFPSFWVLDRAIKDQKKGILHPLKTHEYVLVFKKQTPSALSFNNSK